MSEAKLRRNKTQVKARTGKKQVTEIVGKRQVTAVTGDVIMILERVKQNRLLRLL